jgi:hypothetical protein
MLKMICDDKQLVVTGSIGRQMTLNTVHGDKLYRLYSNLWLRVALILICDDRQD